jgi:hypothetical protein
MTRFILKTDNRQGEYLKAEYNGKDAPNGWNHYTHSKRKKVEEYAQKHNIIGRIEKVVL